MIFIDSNILIDIFTRDTRWVIWSQDALEAASLRGDVAINQIVLAEVAPQLGSIENFQRWLAPFDMLHLGLTDEAAFCAGTAFLEYRIRRRSGDEGGRSILPDFLIGGHAQTLGASILTRDPRFYRTYFPAVPLITPPDEVGG